MAHNKPKGKGGSLFTALADRMFAKIYSFLQILGVVAFFEVNPFTVTFFDAIWGYSAV